jgi:acyl-[acyl-carrier-protein]-phospholipid O-acyltransferase/long-chain-fatty-acid--[acyl-carrier-protein] ligase
MPATVTSLEARQAVLELGADAFARRKRQIKTIPESFIQTARRHPFRFAMADFRTPHLRLLAALVKTIFLARRLRRHWKDQQAVGVMLPPSIGGALVNLAAMIAGKIPVNLNYTASNSVVQSCAEQSGLKTVVTSRLFLEKVKLQLPGAPIFLEDLAEKPGLRERLMALCAALLFPVGAIERAAGNPGKTKLDDVATIIFSSGSTGDPKGVLLTQYNVASNVEQLNQVFMLHRDDRILGILPFFHSFGFTGTLALTSAVGVGVVYHPSPLDSRTIGGLVSQYGVTVMLATPTFLQAYTRRCTPEDFGSLRFVMAGAEKLPDRVSQAFEDHFGIRPLEGYGCTGMFASSGGEHQRFSRGVFPAGGSETRKHRASAAGNRFANGRPGNRRGAGAESAGVVAGARTQCDARLLESPGKNRRGVEGRLVQHRRHRDD